MKTLILTLLIVGGQILSAQTEHIKKQKTGAVHFFEPTKDSLEAKAMKFYSASKLIADSSFLDYKDFLDSSLVNAETENKIVEMNKVLSGKSIINAQIIKANSVGNLYFILLYQPITLEDYGRIRLVYKNDGDQLIDSWDFQ